MNTTNFTKMHQRMIMQHVFRKLSLLLLLLLLLLSFYYGTNVHAKQFPHHRHHHQTTRLSLVTSHISTRQCVSQRGVSRTLCQEREMLLLAFAFATILTATLCCCYCYSCCRWCAELRLA